jgi:hypothetical protein
VVAAALDQALVVQLALMVEIQLLALLRLMAAEAAASKQPQQELVVLGVAQAQARHRAAQVIRQIHHHHKETMVEQV